MLEILVVGTLCFWLINRVKGDKKEEKKED